MLLRVRCALACDAEEGGKEGIVLCSQVVFGEVTSGMDVVEAVEAKGSKTGKPEVSGEERPVEQARVLVNCSTFLGIHE